MKLQLLARTVHGIDIKGKGISFLGLLDATLHISSNVNIIDAILNCGETTCQTRAWILEGYLDLLKETLRRVKILTHLNGSGNPRIRDYRTIVEMFLSWALVNVGNWLLGIFADLAPPSDQYPEFSQHLTASEVVNSALKLELIPQTLKDEVNNIGDIGGRQHR